MAKKSVITPSDEVGSLTVAGTIVQPADTVDELKTETP